MDQVYFDYSMKNINIPPFKNFRLQMFNKTWVLIKNMRWKAHFFLNPSETPYSKETFNFNSTKAPPPVPDMKEFEDKLADMIENIKEKEYKNNFQDKLKKDAMKIAKDDKLIVAADKTHNFYKMGVNEYDEFCTVVTAWRFKDPCTHTRAGDINARTCDEISVRKFTPRARVRVHESLPNLLWIIITNI